MPGTAAPPVLAFALLLLDASSAAALPGCFVAPAGRPMLPFLACQRPALRPASRRIPAAALAGRGGAQQPRSSARRGTGAGCRPASAEAHGPDGLLASVLSSVFAAWWRVLSLSAGLEAPPRAARRLQPCPRARLRPQPCPRRYLTPHHPRSNGNGRAVAAACVCARLGSGREGATGGGAQDAAQPPAREVAADVCGSCPGAAARGSTISPQCACARGASAPAEDGWERGDEQAGRACGRGGRPQFSGAVASLTACVRRRLQFAVDILKCTLCVLPVVSLHHHLRSLPAALAVVCLWSVRQETAALGVQSRRSHNIVLLGRSCCCFRSLLGLAAFLKFASSLRSSSKKQWGECGQIAACLCPCDTCVYARCPTSGQSGHRREPTAAASAAALSAA